MNDTYMYVTGCVKRYLYYHVRTLQCFVHFMHFYVLNNLVKLICIHLLRYCTGKS
jgi:hypothetical protein